MDSFDIKYGNQTIKLEQSETLIGVLPITLPRWITSAVVPGQSMFTSPVSAAVAVKG